MIVLIGATSGIGRELLGRLSKIDDVIATYHSRPIDQIGHNVQTRKLDLADINEIERFARFVADLKEPVSFINMAALSIDDLLVNLADRDWEKVFTINVHSSAYLLKRILPKMINDKWGRVILCSSVVTDSGGVGAAAYTASKAALSGLCKAVACEYGRFNITANLLMLGYFDRGLIETLDEKKRLALLKRIPSGKLGRVEDVFQAVEFIIRTDYLNAATIRLDGGFA